MIPASHRCITLVVCGTNTSSLFDSSNVECAAQLSTIRTIFRPADFILMFNLFIHSVNSIPIIYAQWHGCFGQWNRVTYQVAFDRTNLFHLQYIYIIWGVMWKDILQFARHPWFNLLPSNPTRFTTLKKLLNSLSFFKTFDPGWSNFFFVSKIVSKFFSFHQKHITV